MKKNVYFDTNYNDWCELTISIKTYETDKTYDELHTLWEEIDQKITLLEPKVEIALNEFIASSPDNEMDWVLEDRLSQLEGELEDLKEQRYEVERMEPRIAGRSGFRECLRNSATASMLVISFRSS